MDNNQIQSLAREYAEETVKRTAVENLPDGFKENVIQRNADHFEKHLRWLLRRYCIVEKEAVRKAFKAALYSFNNASDPVMPTMEFHSGEMSALESLFPEIAKEEG